MGFMDEYYKALQEPKQNSGSTGHAVSNSNSSYLDEYNKVIGSNPVVRPAVFSPSVDTGRLITLPFRPGVDNNKLTTLPFRPGNDSGKLVTLPHRVSKDERSTIKDKIESRLTLGNKKDEEEEKEKKWYQKGHFEDGYDFGDVTKTILGIDEDSASLKDLTVGSLKRGYYNSLYGEESFKEMLGEANEKEALKEKLESEEYQFAPGNDFAGAVSGAFEQIGQMGRQFTNPRTLGFTGSAIGAAIIAGNAGPQALVPEEIISVPAVATAAFKASSAASNFEIEAGHAYNEMIELGVSEETAKKVALAVGGGNAALDLIQLDELFDAYKVTKASGVTKPVSKLILDELKRRGVDVLTETAQEDAQELITVGGVQAASMMDKGEFAYSADEVGQRLWDTTKSSALTFGMMNVPATAKNTYSIIKDNKNVPVSQTVQNEHPIVEQIPKVGQEIKPEVEEVKPVTEVKPPEKKVLYTGSPNTDIKQFKVGGVDGSKQTGDRYGRGVYLTTNENTAKNYAGDSGRVYQISADDLNIFNLNDTITPEMRDSLIAVFKGGDTQFRNSMLRNFRTEMTFDDFESAEAFFDHQRKVWKEQDGEYSANKPEIKEADNETGRAVIEFTDFENWENNIGTLTGNHLYDALKSLSTDDFSSFITGHGFDGIAFDEDADNQQYVIYRNEDRLHINEGAEEQTATDQDVAPAVKEPLTTEEAPTISETETVEEAPATEEFSAPEVAVAENETTTDDTGLQWLYDKRQSLNDILMARYQEGLYNEETENLARQWQAVNNEISDIEAHQKQSETSTQTTVHPETKPRELTTTEKVQKHFRDEVLDFDKLFDSDTPENVEKFNAVSIATENAQNLISKGVDGVKSIPAIFDKISTDGNLDDFELYLRHLLNVDRINNSQRSGVKVELPVFGPEVTATMSLAEADRLELAHPEFKQAAEEVYAFNNYLLDLRVRAGRVTQEWADRWKEMYPHYVPISRSRYGDTQAYTLLLNALQGKPLDISNSGAVDNFLGDVDEAAKVHEIDSYGEDFNPLIDTMVNQAFTVYWDLAANHPDSVVAPSFTDGNMQSAPLPSDITVDNVQTQPDSVTIESESPADVPKLIEYYPNKLMDEKKGVSKIVHDVVNAFEEYILDHGFVFEKVAKKVGSSLDATWHATRNAFSSAQHFIGNGDKANGVRALPDIVKDVKNTKAKAEFLSYLGHLRNIDGMSLQSRFGLANNRNFMGRYETFAKSNKAVREFEKAHPEFKKLADDCYAYTDYIRNKFVERGMISQEDAELWKELYPHYVPMRFTSNGSVDYMLETLAQYTTESFNTWAMNEFGVELKNTLQTEVGREPINIDSFISRLDSGDSLFGFGENGKHRTFTVYENGERVTFEITDEMYMALNDSHKWMNWKIPVLHQINEGFRKFCTEWNIFFSLKNGVKDPQDIIYNSRHPVDTYARLIDAGEAIASKEIGKTSKYSHLYEEYLANGGEPITYFDSKSKKFTSWTDPSELIQYVTGLKAVSAINDRVEKLPRLAEYIASREAGRTIKEAMLDSARVTTNFAAGGKFTKFLNRNGCTFLNASVQGALQHARNFAEAASDANGKLHFDTKEAKMAALKGTTALIARGLVVGMATIAINDLRWKDDEDYEKQPDYVKEGYYLLFKYGDGQFFRLPKGRTNATIEEGIRTVAEQSFGDDDADWNNFFKIVMENIAPNNPATNNIFAPLIEVAKGETWYGEDMNPYRLKDEDTVDQFDEKTDRISVGLSKKLDESTVDEWLNEKIDGTFLEDWFVNSGYGDGLSPKEINYLINSYTGVLGDLVLPYFTPKAESPYDDPLNQSLAPLKDIFTTDSVLNNRVTGDFYETLEAAEAKAESKEATLEDKFVSGMLIGYNVEISKLMQEQRDIQTSDLPDSEKYERTRELKKEINALQEKGLEALEDYSIDGIYAESGDKRYNYDSEEDTWWEVKPELANGKPNPYYIQEQLSHDKLGMSYADFWNGKKPPEDFEGKTYYGEFNGKRYNYDVDDNAWYEIKPKTKDGEDNYYYQQEQLAHDKLGVPYEDFWNNREAYMDANYVADRWGEPFYETVKNVFGAEHFADFATGMADVSADKDANGNPINGSRKKKMEAYIYGLDIPDIEKHILFKSQYSYTNKHNYEIINYLNERDDISYEEMESVLKELGFSVDSNGRITW